MASIKKASWPPYLPADVSFRDLSDARLAWLAAEPEVDRRTRGHRWVAFSSVLGGGIARDLVRDRQEVLRTTYAPAVDAAATRMTATEMAALRAGGTLPEWFFDEVERHRGASSG